jgi:hypothetical protein
MVQAFCYKVGIFSPCRNFPPFDEPDCSLWYNKEPPESSLRARTLFLGRKRDVLYGGSLNCAYTVESRLSGISLYPAPRFIRHSVSSILRFIRYSVLSGVPCQNASFCQQSTQIQDNESIPTTHRLHFVYPVATATDVLLFRLA